MRALDCPDFRGPIDSLVAYPPSLQLVVIHDIAGRSRGEFTQFLAPVDPDVPAQTSLGRIAFDLCPIPFQQSGSLAEEIRPIAPAGQDLSQQRQVDGRLD